MVPPYRDPMIRFMEKIQKSPDGCWLWTAYVNRKGYGIFGAGPGMPNAYAHRWSYEHHLGPIPEAMQVHHVCHVERCVNPDHLRLATNKQNCESRSYASITGLRGVKWNRNNQRWEAAVKHFGRSIYLGLYDTPEEAGEAARLKRLELFTHNAEDAR